MGIKDAAKSFGKALKALSDPAELIKDLSKEAARKALNSRIDYLKGRRAEAVSSRDAIEEFMQDNVIAFADSKNKHPKILHLRAIGDWNGHIKTIDAKVKAVEKMIKKL